MLVAVEVTGRSITSTPTMWNGRFTGMGWSGGGRCCPVPETVAHSGQFLTNCTVHSFPPVLVCQALVSAAYREMSSIGTAMAHI